MTRIASAFILVVAWIAALVVQLVLLLIIEPSTIGLPLDVAYARLPSSGVPVLASLGIWVAITAVLPIVFIRRIFNVEKPWRGTAPNAPSRVVWAALVVIGATLTASALPVTVVLASWNRVVPSDVRPFDGYIPTQLAPYAGIAVLLAAFAWWVSQMLRVDSAPRTRKL